VLGGRKNSPWLAKDQVLALFGHGVSLARRKRGDGINKSID
jgi:hypothetical protein